MAVGGAIVAAVVAPDRRMTAIAGSAIALTAVTLIGAAAEKTPHKLLFAAWSIGALFGGASATSVLRWLLLETKAWPFDRIGRWLRVDLATASWPEGARQSDLDQRALMRRWIIAMSAAAGAVTGALMALPSFWEAAFEAISPRGLMTLLVLMVISLLIVSPAHKAIVSGLHEPSRVDSEAKPGEPVPDPYSWPKAGKFAGVLVLLLLLDLGFSSLEQSLKEGRINAVFAIFFNFLTPAIVSYYWTAAIQLRVASVWQRTTWPATLTMSMIMVGLSLSLVLLIADHIFWSGNVGDRHSMAFTVIGLMAFIFWLMGFCTTGIFAWFGGWVIDNRRNHRLGWWLLGALLVATLPAMMMTYGIAVLGETSLLLRDYAAFILPVVGWLAALRLSNFLQVARSYAPLPVETPVAAPQS